MAENKKSFVLYSDAYGLVKQLPDEVAGRLFKHIFAYVNDENPSTEELLVNVAFEPIKAQLKRDLQKWENQMEQRRQAGLRSAEVRKQNATSVNERLISSTVNDNVNVNVINIEERKVNFANSLKPYLPIYGKDMLNDFYAYWTEHDEKDKKFRREKEKSFNIERRLETWKRNDKKFNFQPTKQDKL